MYTYWNSGNGPSDNVQQNLDRLPVVSEEIQPEGQSGGSWPVSIKTINELTIKPNNCPPAHWFQRNHVDQSRSVNIHGSFLRNSPKLETSGSLNGRTAKQTMVWRRAAGKRSKDWSDFRKLALSGRVGHQGACTGG